MASSCSMNCFHIGMIFFAMILSSSSASRHLSDASKSTTHQLDTMSFEYHKGPLLRGRYSINLIWYGAFKPAQRAIIADFVTSLQISPSQHEAQPSVATWWGSVAKLYPRPVDHKPSASSPLSVSLGRQIIDESYSVGKSLTLEQVESLASKGGINSVNVVLTADDVAVEGFCTSSCGGHGSTRTAGRSRSPYVWVGNSVKQCPGWCAWPFHQPVYGPQSPALVAPNNDVGLDGMVINLAGLLAGTATNPFGNGYYQGPQEAPLEAATACPGVYGKGAYPGYPGQLLVDPTSGASYNANGVNGRRFLLPALFDPSTSTCSTLV